MFCSDLQFWLIYILKPMWSVKLTFLSSKLFFQPVGKNVLILRELAFAFKADDHLSVSYFLI